MIQNNNIKTGMLKDLTDLLGMKDNDVNNILTSSLNTEEQKYSSIGPGPYIPYLSSYYGTISIKDF